MEEILDNSLPVGQAQLKKFMQILERYKAGKRRTEQRILAAENWWKLRNTQEEQKVTAIGTDGGFTAASGWLHNVIVSKHADAMESYPEPLLLPREPDDQPEANRLSAIVPCVLEQNHFEDTYCHNMWQKLKTGTAVYKVIWDSTKLHGLGDISVEPVNLLCIYWEPGISDIQRSPYFFHTELVERSALETQYPHLKGKLRGKRFQSTRFLYDDPVDTRDKHTVIEVYYRKGAPGGQMLHYCRFVEDQLLFASENDPRYALRGWYDHGKYPYVFDTLYPIEGSPCGYGFVDVCRNPQTVIDLLSTSFVRNAMVGATPRYFRRQDGGVNAQQFLDLSQPLVDVAGNLDENALRRIEHNPLDGNYIAMLDRVIDELRQTSGNTETSTGNVSAGVTAASAIAALQEASGKGSRDANRTAYRAFAKVVELTVELIRQFYGLPRTFRILGTEGGQEFVSYSNTALRPQPLGADFGLELGYRLPVFDIKVSAQKKDLYTRVSQNELALQFFKLGFFDPQRLPQALVCMEMMDFEGKEALVKRLSTLQPTIAPAVM